MDTMAQQEFADSRERLYPMLMSAAHIQEKGGGQMVTSHLVDDLYAIYVMDMDRYRVRYITYDDLKLWGVSHSVLHVTCVKNLEKLTTPLRFTKLDNPQNPNPMYVWNQQDGYDAARLLLPAYMQEFALGVHGRLIFGVPDRHWFVAVGDADPQIVDFVARKVKDRHHGAEFPVSPHLYVWEDGAVERYR